MGVADISRYIGFARLFKPKVTEEAMDYLVSQYKQLRQRDTGGGVKSSWRITVRQLESMIRLSESMARLSCSDQVTPKHVKEAYRLLNKSIIRVDQPDIHFDEEEEEMEEAEEQIDDPDNVRSPPVPTPTGDSQQPGERNKKQLKLSYEEYKTMATLVVHHLRTKEAEDIRRSDVVNWYLENMVSQEGGVDLSQEDVLEKKQICEKVLDRLAYQDNVLVPISKTGLKSSGAAATVSEMGDGDDQGQEDPILIVHPNYAE